MFAKVEVGYEVGQKYRSYVVDFMLVDTTKPLH
jgi:hypothetical protein